MFGFSRGGGKIGIALFHPRISSGVIVVEPLRGFNCKMKNATCNMQHEEGITP
jgi:hypothetical protein